MKVIFPITKQAGTNLIEYPDTKSLFSNTKVIGTDIIADYSGALPLTAYTGVDEEKRTEKLTALNAWHDEQTAIAKAKYSQADLEMFLDKRTEALKWRADSTVATPVADGIVGGDAVLRVVLLNAILAKVDEALQLSWFVEVTRGSIKACTTQAALDLITW